MRDWLAEYWIPVACAVAVLALIGVIVWAALSGGLDCPQGQQAEFWYFQPIVTTTTTTLIPIYHCVAVTG
jgi:hypothetical protein